MIRKLFLLLLLLVPTTAHAQWREATSRHFIVYSELSEDKLRERVTELEKFDFLLRAVTGMNKPDSPIKLRIFMVDGLTGVIKTLPAGAGGGIAGYYNATSRGPFAVMPMKDTGWGSWSVDAQSTLFHEYTHHFMLANFPAAYPTWFTEGFAEYYGQTKIDGNAFEVGIPVEERYATLRLARWLPVGKMLTAKSYNDVGGALGQLYAQGWLAVHYLSANKDRAEKLLAYLNALNQGKDFDAARDEVFGEDARQLNEELYAYSRKRRLDTVRMEFEDIDVGAISIRQLSRSEQELLPYDIALTRGLLVREAQDFAAEVRRIARDYPNDPYALSILVDAERAVGNWDAASAAVDRWLAVQPSSPRALMHKGALRVRQLREAKSTDTQAWAAARETLVQAHRLDKNDPRVLEAYYDSFTAQGVLPPAGAQNALYRAYELIPQADELRYKVALDFDKRDMTEDAIGMIKPSAYSLHAAEDESEREKRRREKQEEKWRGVDEEKHETAHEMLVRLEKKLAEKGGAQSATGETPAAETASAQ